MQWDQTTCPETPRMNWYPGPPVLWNTYMICTMIQSNRCAKFNPPSPLKEPIQFAQPLPRITVCPQRPFRDVQKFVWIEFGDFVVLASVFAPCFFFWAYIHELESSIICHPIHPVPRIELEKMNCRVRIPRSWSVDSPSLMFKGS